MKKLNAQGVQTARTGVHIATQSRKNERNPKPTVLEPKPALLGGSGSPKCLRGVGLIQMPQP